MKRELGAATVKDYLTVQSESGRPVLQLQPALFLGRRPKDIAFGELLMLTLWNDVLRSRGEYVPSAKVSAGSTVLIPRRRMDHNPNCGCNSIEATRRQEGRQ